MLKALIRPVMIGAAFLAGYFCPWAHSFNWMIRILLLVMLYLVCLQVKFKQLRPHLSHWKILAFNIAVPLILWGVLRLAGQEDLASIAFFTAITPTANAAPVIIRFLGGSVSYVVAAFIITNLGVSISLLGLLPLVTGNFSMVFFWEVAINLAVIIGVPIAGATVTRMFFKRAQEWPSRLANFSFFLWVVTLFIIAASASFFLHHNPELSPLVLLETALLSALICALNFAGGRFMGEKRYRRESSQSLGQKNTTFTMFLALHFANPLVAMGPTFYVLWHNLWNALQMLMHDRRRTRKAQMRQAGHPRQAEKSRHDRRSASSETLPPRGGN